MWDWGHHEDEDGHASLIWLVRYMTSNFNIIEATDPAVYADFMPQYLLGRLVTLGFDFTNVKSIDVC